MLLYKKLFFVVCLFLACLCSSCFGIFTGASLANVEGQSDKWRVVRHVEDSEHTTIILGIGGLAKQHLTGIILNRIKSGLASDERLINIATTVSTKNYLSVYASSEIKVTADVVKLSGK